MSVKAKIEAIIYATEEPVTLNQLVSLLKDNLLAEIRREEEARLTLNELVAEPVAPEEDPDEETIEFEEPEVAAVVRPGPAAGTEAAPAAEPQPTAEETRATEKEELKRVKDRISSLLDELIAEYASDRHGVEIRQIAGGYRMATKPEHHDVVVGFAKSLKPPIRLSLQALETLSVIAYKQPITVPEISEIRGVDSAGVIATLLDRKLVTTAGRKQVIGRPILYKTTKEFLLRFGLNDVGELPSMEEFEKLGDPQAELFQTPEQPKTPSPAETASEDEPVTEADRALASPENGQAAANPDDSEPERFKEAVAPVPGVDTLDSKN
jgi:segregation and condensation protein B